MAFLDFISSFAPIMGSIGSNIVNAGISNQNLAFQREANQQNEDFVREINDLNYQRQLEENNLTRLREDTAAQRAAADFKAAGLSKTLAAGNTSNSASMKSSVAESYEKKALENQLKFDNIMQNLDIAGTKAKIEGIKNENILTQAQSENINADTELTKAKIPLAQIEADLYKSERKLYDIEGLYRGEQLKYEVAQKIGDLDLTYANYNYVIARTVNEISQTEKLDVETEKALFDYFTAEADYELLSSEGYTSKGDKPSLDKAKGRVSIFKDIALGIGGFAGAGVATGNFFNNLKHKKNIDTYSSNY